MSIIPHPLIYSIKAHYKLGSHGLWLVEYIDRDKNLPALTEAGSSLAGNHYVAKEGPTYLRGDAHGFFEQSFFGGRLEVVIPYHACDEAPDTEGLTSVVTEYKTFRSIPVVIPKSHFGVLGGHFNDMFAKGAQFVIINDTPYERMADIVTRIIGTHHEREFGYQKVHRQDNFFPTGHVFEVTMEYFGNDLEYSKVVGHHDVLQAGLNQSEISALTSGFSPLHIISQIRNDASYNIFGLELLKDVVYTHPSGQTFRTFYFKHADVESIDYLLEGRNYSTDKNGWIHVFGDNWATPGS